MAQFVLTDAYVYIGSTNYSAGVVSVTVTLAKEALDDTAMGDSARSNAMGIEANSISIEFFQDFSSNIDTELWTAWNAGTALTVLVKPVDTTASGTNPSYSVSCMIPEYTPIDGAVGEMATFTQAFVGNAAVSRGTG